MQSPSLLLKTYATFQEGKDSKSLSALCKDLLTEQKETWRDLWNGYESLKDIRVRDVCCNGFSVRLQNNTGRIRSTLARVGEGTTSDEPCFLCLDNLPEGQKGILYRGEYLILCNPMPVFHSHLTVANVNHYRQSLGFHIITFLQLMADFGPGWTLLYNGPKCGASAPNHLHFQAVPKGKLPIEAELLEQRRFVLVARVDSVRLYHSTRLGREAIVLEGRERIALSGAFEKIVVALKEVLCTDEEPMMNVAGSLTEDGWRFVVFPRRKHRPDAFFREGDSRVVVSPGVVEMAGVIVTPVERDFERLDAETVEGIYEEVSLEGGTVDRALVETIRAARACSELTMGSFR